MAKIRFERVKEFPWHHRLNEYAKKEFDLVPQSRIVAEMMVKRSACWMIYYEKRPMVLIGLARLSLVGYGSRIWLVAFRDFDILYPRMIRTLRRGLWLLRKCRGQLSTAINLDEKKNVRFAEHLGFRRDGNVFYENGARLQYFVLR